MTKSLSTITAQYESIVRMSSREMAEVTETRHDNVKRTIDLLVEKGVISKPQIEDGIKAANGVVERLYLVGKRDSYVIVAQLSPEFTARLVDRWQALETGTGKPIAMHPTKVFGDYFKVSRLIGLDRNVSAISANQATIKLTGTNVLQLIGHTALVNEEQTLYYTPTQLGAMQEPPVSPQNINRKLAGLGLQQHVETKSGGMWAPTGKAHGLYQVLDTGKAHNSGAMVQQIKWSKAALQGGAQ